MLLHGGTEGGGSPLLVGGVARRPEREGERVTQRSDKVVDATWQAEGAKIA